MNLSRVDDPRSGEADKPGDEIEHDADDPADDKAAGDAPDAVDQPEDGQDVEVEDAPSAGGDGPHDRYEDADHADDDRRPGADDLRSEPQTRGRPDPLRHVPGRARRDGRRLVGGR